MKKKIIVPVVIANENIKIEDIQMDNTQIDNVPAFMMEKEDGWYTLDEVIEQMRPQTERDKILINDCIKNY